MLAEGPAASFAIVPYARQRLGPDYERFPRLIFAEYSQTNPMQSPSDLQTAASTRMLEEAIEIISHVDPVIHGEIKALLRRIYLATANKDPSAKRFGGVTSFLVVGCVLYQYRVLQNALGRGSISRPRDYSWPSVRSQL